MAGALEGLKKMLLQRDEAAPLSLQASLESRVHRKGFTRTAAERLPTQQHCKGLASWVRVQLSCR